MAIRPPTLTRAQRAFLLTVGGLTPAHLTPGTPEYEKTLQVYQATVSDRTKPPTLSQAYAIKRDLGLPKAPVIQPTGTIDISQGMTTDGKLPTGVTLSLSDPERQALLTQQAQATCEADRQKLEPKTYKATLKGGGYVLVEANNKETAQQRATEAGYNVQRVTWSPSYTETKAKVTTPEVAMPKDAIELTDKATGNTLVVSKSDWDALPSKYKDTFQESGFNAMQWQITRDFESNNTQLADGRWMSNTDFRNLEKYDRDNGTAYAQTARDKGWAALQTQIAYTEAAQKVATDKMDEYKSGDGYNLLAAVVDGITPQTMKNAGFEDKDIEWAQNTYKTSLKTAVALPDDVTWLNPSSGKEYTDAEYKQLLADYDAKVKATAGTPEFYELGPNPRDTIRLSDRSARRLIVEGTSMFFFQPARALLPEVELKDISKFEWVVGGAQLATWLMPVIPAKVVPVVSAGASGVFGYATVTGWKQMKPGEKALGVAGTVLVGLPALLAVGSKLGFARPPAKTIGTRYATPEGRLQLLNRIVGFQTDVKTSIEGIKDAVVISRINKAYNEFGQAFARYSRTQLGMKEIQKMISDVGLAKSKNALAYLKQLQAAEAKLAARLKTEGQVLQGKTQAFTDLYLKNAKGIGDMAPWELAEIRDRAKTILMDSDALTTQLFGTRDAMAIAKDVAEVRKQIAVIEAETKRGMPVKQVQEYAKVVKGLETDIAALNQELRIRELLGEKVTIKGENLTMEVMSLQRRLSQAVGEMKGYKGTVQDYPTFRKGELATQAKVLQAERDIIESIQKTTEPMWGRESYGQVLQKLNDQLDDIISAMRKAGMKTDKATKATFDIYGALREQNPKALKAAVEKLRLEAGKIPNKPLQLKAGEQVKMIEGLTADALMKRVSVRPKGATPDIEPARGGMAAEAYQAKLLQAKAQQIIDLRYEALARDVPDYIKRKGPEAVMRELRKSYKDYPWERAYGGKFRDLDDFLDIERVMSEIRRGIGQDQTPLPKEWQEKIEEVINRENELKVARRIESKTTDPKLKERIAEYIRQSEKELNTKKVALKEATEAKPLEKTVTEAEREKMKVATTETEKKALITAAEAEKDRLARIKAEERAAQQIKKAIKPAEAKPTEAPTETYKGGFPGVKPKTASERLQEAWAETSTERALDGLIALGISAKTATQIQPAIRTAVRTGVQAATKTQTQTKPATKTQLKTAVEPAVETALKTATEAIPKTELKPITKLVTETVIDTIVTTKVAPPPPPPPWPPITRRYRLVTDKVERKKLLEGPALATHKQGIFYISWYPRTRDGGPLLVVYSRKRPPGALTATGRRSPQRTFRGIGKLPPEMVLQMGIVTARAKHGRHLTFSRRNGNRRRGRIISTV